MASNNLSTYVGDFPPYTFPTITPAVQDWSSNYITTYTTDKATLSVEELSYLQKLAKKDAELKRILAKLQSLISVEVDFNG